MGDLNIKLDNKIYYLLVFVLVVIVISGITIAYNSGGPPSVMGHSLDEIELPNCADGEVITKIAGVWSCGTGGGGTFSPSYDSGWFPVDDDTTYTKTHNLGTKDYLTLTLFREDSSASYYNVASYFSQPFRNTWNGDDTGSVILEQADNYIKIKTADVYVNGIGEPDISSSYHKGSGEYRILLWTF